MRPTGVAPDRAERVKDALVDPTGLGLELRRDGTGWKALCPWHAERTASLSVRVLDGRLLAHCFGCGRTGSAIDLVAAARGIDARIDFARALELAESVAGLSGTAAPPPVRRAVAPAEPPVDLAELQAVQHRIHQVLLEVAPMTEEGVAFFAGRGIWRDEIPTNFAFLPRAAEQRRVVEAVVGEIGRSAWRERSGMAALDGGFTHPANRLVIPWPSAPGAGAPTGALQRRRVDRGHGKDDRYRSPRQPVVSFPMPFGVERLPERDVDHLVVLVEGALDAVAAKIIAERFGFDWVPLALGSAAGWLPTWAPLLAGRTVAVGLDADARGEAEATKLLKTLANDDIAAVRIAPKPQGRDWGDVLAALRGIE